MILIIELQSGSCETSSYWAETLILDIESLPESPFKGAIVEAYTSLGVGDIRYQDVPQDFVEAEFPCTVSGRITLNVA